MSNLIRKAVLLPLILVGQVSSVWADATDALEFFQEEAKVTTASRREQTIAEIPMAVDVITPEEIKASGVTTVWDLFRFRPGMDVIDGRSADANRAIVSMRGFPEPFVANLLLLIDGRSAYTSYDNGTYWDIVPVQMQDIERIEIIRGPNAAMYGTGAGFGVINIITKKPQGETALTLDNRGGNLGLFQSAEALEGHLGKMNVRASYTYREQQGFPAVSTHEEGNDAFQKHMASLRANMPLGAKTELQMFFGGTSADEATQEPYHDPNSGAYFKNHAEMVKLSHSFTPHSTVELTGARNDYTEYVRGPTRNTVRPLQYDADLLHRLDFWQNRLNTTYGVSYRNAETDSIDEFGGAPRIEFYRGYFQQMVKPIESFTLQGAVSLESTNISGLHPSYQVAAIEAPVPEHAFRASYSVAHTVPAIFGDFSSVDFIPGVRIEGNRDVLPMRVTNYEIGYHGELLDRRFQVDTSLYYMLVNNFNNSIFKGVIPDGNGGIIFLSRWETYDNSIARGSETQLKYHFSATRWIYANYTYEHITDTAGDVTGKTGTTPAHKFNLGGASDLGYGFSGSVDFGYKDHYQVFSIANPLPPLAVPAYWRMDMRLAYTWPWYKNCELYMAGQNLLQSQHVEFVDALYVPRMYQGGVSIKFGGK